MQYKFDIDLGVARATGFADVEKPDVSVGFSGGCVIEQVSLDTGDYSFELSGQVLDMLEALFGLRLTKLEDEVLEDWKSNASDR